MNDQLQTLAQALGTYLEPLKRSVTTAESCTGGGIAQAITAVAGSSAWFNGGFVTYSNACKSSLLGVPAELISRCGAVSEEVVHAMAEGAALRMQAEYAVAVSGIAGPGGGSEDKPVGTVCFGWRAMGKVRVERCWFAGDRTAVREQSVIHALEGMLEDIKNTV